MHTKYNKNQNINSFSLLTLNFLLKEVIWPGLVFALNQSNLRGIGLTLMGLTLESLILSWDNQVSFNSKIKAKTMQKTIGKQDFSWKLTSWIL